MITAELTSAEHQRLTLEDLLFQYESAELTNNTLEVMSIASSATKDQIEASSNLQDALDEIKT